MAPARQRSILPHHPELPRHIFAGGLGGGERQARSRTEQLHGLRTQTIEAAATRAHPEIAFRVLDNIDDVGMGRFHAFDALRIESKEAAGRRANPEAVSLILIQILCTAYIFGKTLYVLIRGIKTAQEIRKLREVIELHMENNWRKNHVPTLPKTDMELNTVKKKTIGINFRKANVLLKRDRIAVNNLISCV